MELIYGRPIDEGHVTVRGDTTIRGRACGAALTFETRRYPVKKMAGRGSVRRGRACGKAPTWLRQGETQSRRWQDVGLSGNVPRDTMADSKLMS
jgi:hypothetical protein